MNKIFFLAAFIFFSGSVSAQAGAQQDTSAYTKFGIPAFKLNLVPDSSVFDKSMLKKKKATVIMIFSPECGHCEASVKNLVLNYNLFKKVQIVMATSLPYNTTTKFYNDLGLAKYPNIKVGLDPSYFLGTFYNINSYPSIYLYDKKGKFVHSFNSESDWEEIAKYL